MYFFSHFYHEPSLTLICWVPMGFIPVCFSLPIKLKLNRTKREPDQKLIISRRLRYQIEFLVKCASDCFGKKRRNHNFLTMNSLTITMFVAFMGFQCLSALPLHKDIDNEELLRLPSSSTTSITPTTSTTVTSTTTETVLRSVETTAAAITTTTTTESPVSDLLSAIFRQTIYTRIESLLLDPGKRSDEKQKIVDSAVSNYHRQKMFGTDDDDDDANSSDNNVSVESVTKEDSNDISKSTG